MFTVYFDASGDQRAPVVTVAGFVARKKKRKKFEDTWPKILSVNPKVSFFHTTDFVSSRKGWEDWKDEPEKRIKLIGDLTACIGKNTNEGFAVTVRKTEYSSVNEVFRLSEERINSYVLGGLGVLGQLEKWAKKKSINHQEDPCDFRGWR